MKAFLLAAGLGTRLKPLTDAVPKCLMPINGKPLMYYWLKLCEKYGISEILVNVHRFREQVEHFISTADFSGKIHLRYEDKLLGSGGTIKANESFIKDEKCFFILFGDNLTNANLQKLLVFHSSHGEILTMGLFRTDTPQSCGIADLDRGGRVINFVEKPEKPTSNLANAGIYVASPLILSYFPDRDFIDLGYDVLPKLAGRMYGYLIEDYLIDIGTRKNYDKAQADAVFIPL
jgi:mannose-1-phosphate guanylyltransferase